MVNFSEQISENAPSQRLTRTERQLQTQPQSQEVSQSPQSIAIAKAQAQYDRYSQSYQSALTRREQNKRKGRSTARDDIRIDKAKEKMDAWRDALNQVKKGYTYDSARNEVNQSINTPSSFESYQQSLEKARKEGGLKSITPVNPHMENGVWTSSGYEVEKQSGERMSIPKEKINTFIGTEKQRIEENLIPSRQLFPVPQVKGFVYPTQPTEKQYNKEVSNLYQEQAKSTNIQVGIPKIEDNWFNNIQYEGAFFSKENKIVLNPLQLLKIPPLGFLDFSNTFAHEVGHKVDYSKSGQKSTESYEEFTDIENRPESFWDKLSIIMDKSWMAYSRSGREVYAQEFAKYVKNPSGYAIKNPKISTRFEKDLGYNPEEAKNIEIKEPYVLPEATEKGNIFLEASQKWLSENIPKVGKFLYNPTGIKTNRVSAPTIFDKEGLTYEQRLIRAGQVIDYGSYLIPYVGEARFMLSDVPAFESKVIRTKGEYALENPVETAGMLLYGGGVVFGGLTVKGKTSLGIKDSITGKNMVIENYPKGMLAKAIYSKQVKGFNLPKVDKLTGETTYPRQPSTSIDISSIDFMGGAGEIDKQLAIGQVEKFKYIENTPVLKENIFGQIFKPVEKWKYVIKTEEHIMYSPPIAKFKGKDISGTAKPIGKEGDMFETLGAKRYYKDFDMKDLDNSYLIREQGIIKVTNEGKIARGFTIQKRPAGSGLTEQFGIDDITSEISINSLVEKTSKAKTGLVSIKGKRTMMSDVTPSTLTMDKIERIGKINLKTDNLIGGEVEVIASTETKLYGLTKNTEEGSQFIYSGKKPKWIFTTTPKEAGFTEFKGGGKSSSNVLDMYNQKTGQGSLTTKIKQTIKNTFMKRVSLPENKITSPQMKEFILGKEIPSYLGGTGKSMGAFAGTGKYEISESELTKGFTMPMTKISNLFKNPIRNREMNILKENNLLKVNNILKSNQLLKNQLKMNQALKQQQVTRTRQNQMLKNIQNFRFGTNIRFGNPKFPEPVIKLPPIILGLEKPMRRLRNKKFKESDFLGALPDFTSIALGLKPQEFKSTDINRIMRKINKIQTGFEIRTGGRIR